jgi:hypothetical protein
MSLLPFNVLVLNLVSSTVVFYLAYRWLLKPHLANFAPQTVVMPILMLQSLRYLGLMFLTQGVVGDGIPMAFAWPTAVGDCIAASLALTTAYLIQKKSRFAHPMLWVFGVFGTLDFVMAITLSRIFQPNAFLGAAYWIPAFWVPMLLVGHAIIFAVLRQMRQTGGDLFSKPSAVKA